MSEPVEWHDLVRRQFDSIDAAKAVLPQFMKSNDITVAAVLKRKLDSGFTLAAGPEMKYVHIVEVIRSNKSALTGTETGAVYIEVMNVALITKENDG